MPVRIPSTLLKSAALLLLGASFLAGTKANAVTVFDWTSNVNPVGPSGIGTFTINEDIGVLTPGTGYEITNITGTFNGATISTLLPVNGFNGNSNLYYYNTSNFFALDNPGVSFNADPGSGLLVSYNLYGAETSSATTFDNDDGISGGTFTSTASVPGPLPILGIPAVLFYTRKLKKRIKARREASSASLD